MRPLLSSGALLAAIACAPVPPAAAGEKRIATCDAGKAQALVGRAAAAEVGAEALRLSGARAIRWIRRGDLVTMDYREDRLNIDVDANDRVRALRCG